MSASAAGWVLCILSVVSARSWFETKLGRDDRCDAPRYGGPSTPMHPPPGLGLVLRLRWN